MWVETPLTNETNSGRTKVRLIFLKRKREKMMFKQNKMKIPENSYERIMAIGIEPGKVFSIIPEGDQIKIEFDDITIAPSNQYIFDLDGFGKGNIRVIKSENHGYLEHLRIIAYLMLGQYEIKYNRIVPEEGKTYFAPEIDQNGNLDVECIDWSGNSKKQQALLENDLIFKHPTSIRRLIYMEHIETSEKLRKIRSALK